MCAAAVAPPVDVLLAAMVALKDDKRLRLRLLRGIERMWRETYADELARDHEATRLMERTVAHFTSPKRADHEVNVATIFAAIAIERAFAAYLAPPLASSDGGISSGGGSGVAAAQCDRDALWLFEPGLMRRLQDLLDGVANANIGTFFLDCLHAYTLLTDGAF